MAKLNEEAAQELPLNDERLPEPKKNRHVVIATRHLNKRLAALLSQRDKLSLEIEEIVAAIGALE